MVQSARCLDPTPGTNAACTAQAGLWNYAKNFNYNAAGAVTSMQLGNNRWESTQFNSRLQPTQIALGTVQNGSDKLKLEYGYGSTANNGNVLSQTITVPTVGQTAGFTAVQNYEYDSLNRLKSAEEKPYGWTECTSDPTKCWEQTFTFDRYGNRNFDEANTTFTGFDKLCSNGTELCAELRKIMNPSVNTADNRLSSSDGYDFDTSGNTTEDAQERVFIYDAENKQVKVLDSEEEIIGEYFYDGDGKRIKKVVPSEDEVTVFVYNASGQLVAEYSTEISQTPKVSYTTADHLGSPRILTDENGATISRRDFHPFGEEVFTTHRHPDLGYQPDDVRQKFTTYERDIETDLDFAEARTYSKNIGRFTTPDPLLSSGAINNPQTWNRFRYALNNPLLFVDPFGLYEWAASAGGSATDEDLLARSKDKTLKKKERGLAEKQYKFRQAFKAGLETARNAATDPRLTTDQRAEAQRAVNSYGEWKPTDTVSVGMVENKKKAPNVAFGETDGKIHVDLNFDLSNRNQAITIAHEGSHVADFQEFVNSRGTSNESAKGVDLYTTETRAYFVSSYFAQALNVSPYYPESSKDRQIWNKGWKTSQREVKRANGVANYTPWSNENRGRKLSELDKNKRY